MSTPYDSQQVKTILAERGAQVEAYLQHCLDAIPMQGRLKEAMYYSLLAGGKRLRPVLCLSTAALFGLSAEAVMPFAASLEMIHTYSLIHDDLPAMDDDDLRRGRPSCHKAFDEATAILAGDALLTDAFGFMASTVKDLPAGRVLEALASVSSAAGSAGMVGGQILDMDCTGKTDVPLETLQTLHALKTGAMFRVACVSGGLLAGASEPDIASLRAYGFDPGELDQIESRLDAIYRLKKRFGLEAEELLARREQDAAELETIQSSGETIAKLRAEMQELYQKARAAAETLTESRLKAFTAMNKQMKAALEFLNMPGIRFALRHARGALSSHGQDNVEFLISTNPGEEPKPLAKIASGGELSRIMLAFKSALADRDELPTVIYDEIDTGVSGLAAGRIGQLLHETAAGHQVLCITHTPQVAAFADNQLLIQKNVRDGRTFTEIHPLDLEGRIQVLANMISGDKVTELSLANARELIEKSQDIPAGKEGAACDRK